MKRKLPVVLVVESASLLDEGIANLLRQISNLAVSSIACQDASTLCDQVSQAFPDVIVLTDDCPLDPTRFFELLKDSANHDSLRVIVVQSHRNMIDVYDTAHIFDKKSVGIQTIFDLISFIR